MAASTIAVHIPESLFHKLKRAAYHRSVLRRAKALAILAQRGHRVPITAKTAQK